MLVFKDVLSMYIANTKLKLYQSKFNGHLKVMYHDKIVELSSMSKPV